MSSAHLQQLQAHYARRREIEHQRNERTEQLSRYYDEWGKYTTRYQNWTGPQYYKTAQEKMRQREETRKKEESLEKRRDKLRELLQSETLKYEEEQKMKWRPRSRQCNASNEMLEKISEHNKEQEQMRKKLELEAKLYGRWRHGVDDDKLIFEKSKTDNEVMAKLNWLDKQVENQLEREREQKEAEERQLRMQEEMARIERMRKEREKIREQEIKEIRGLQEEHMRYLNERQQECERLKEQEQAIRAALEEIDKERELLEESVKFATASANDSLQGNNIKNIKLFVKQRSQIVIQHIQLLIEMLERLSEYALKRGDVNQTLCKYKEQLEKETNLITQIEGMYESEAKSKLARYEEIWKTQQLQRGHDMSQILKNEQCTFSALLNDNLQRQADTLEMRATHLSSIENSNDKLNQLLQESEQDASNEQMQIEQSVHNMPTMHADAMSMDSYNDGGSLAAQSKMPATDDATKSIRSNASILPAQNITPNVGRSFNRLKQSYRGEQQPELMPKLMNSFNNLNLDCWDNVSCSRGVVENPVPQAVTAEKPERPKFGRRRIAWT